MADTSNGKARASRAKTSRSKSGTASHPAPAASQPAPAASEPQSHGGVGCPVSLCPICLAVSAVQPLRPDVVEHLLKAGSELFLAVRAVIDARGDGVDREPDRPSAGPLEKIDIG
jgi:hypothetical protein